LRSDGVELERLHADFGFELLRHQHGLVRQLVDRELAVLDNHTLRLTSKGYLLCDEICERLLR
jgi:coproporphyrinogen III oxidase-like Fe-S oxidoreductase